MVGELAAMAVAVCWAISASLFAAAGKRVGSLTVNIVRMAIALALLCAFGLIFRGRLLPTDASGHQWLWLSVSGLVGFTLGDLCGFQSLVLQGPRRTMLIMSLWPAMTAVMSWVFLGERLGWLAVLGIAVTLAGVMWVVLEENPSSAVRFTVRGVLLALGAALGQAVGVVLAKHGMNGYDPFASTQIRAIAGMAGFVAIFSVLGRWRLTASALRDGRAVVYTTAGAFFGPFLGVALTMLAIQLTATGIASTIIATVPILLLGPAILLHKEQISWRAILGAFVAVGGVAMLFLAK